MDRYTKAVLTVIAACLVWNIVSSKNIPQAAAEGSGDYVLRSMDSHLERIESSLDNIERYERNR